MARDEVKSKVIFKGSVIQCAVRYRNLGIHPDQEAPSEVHKKPFLIKKTAAAIGHCFW